MPEKLIRKFNNTEQDSSSDNDGINNASNSANELVNPNSENESIRNWFIANFLAGLAMTIFFMIILVRNQSKSELINPRTKIAAPLNFPLQPSFFSVIEESQDWLKQIQFSIDESISSKDYSLAQTYIKRQKKLLASIPLSPAQKMALSKTTIYWVDSSLINPPNEAMSYSFVLEPRKIVIALHKGLSKAELRSTLLNEIHHVTVYEINQYKLKNKLIMENILEFPFVNEQGELDNSLRAKLSIAIDKLNQNMKDFISLEANKYRNPLSEKRFSRYLDAISDYQPKVYRVSSHISDREIDVVELEGGKGTLYRNNRPIVYEEEGKIQLLCSANKDDSRLELARALFFDYVSAYVNLKTAYKSQDKNTEAVEYAKHSQFLVEFSSIINAMLTPRMKQVFAKRFVNYFDHYVHSYESYFAEENIADWIKGRLSA